MKIVLFGAGAYASLAIKLLGKDSIAYAVDNDPKKNGTSIDGISIFYYEDKRTELAGFRIVVSVSEKYEEEIVQQLRKDGLLNFKKLGEIRTEITLEKIRNQFNGIAVFNKAKTWIRNNTLEPGCIICNSDKRKGYPEVTGYYIPTLLRWGYRDLAKKYALWLMSIQEEDGSWKDTDGQDPYVFDTAQILKGLLAIRNSECLNNESVDASIKKGCDWIIGRMTKQGRLVTPSEKCWGEDESICSELIHLYCLSPLVDAGHLYSNDEYARAAEKIFEYYDSKYRDKIMNFSLLSHFYAYVMEALLDLGHEDMCREAMDGIAKLQKESGAVPALNNVDWVCSTGLFQLALVWFRLGDLERGNRAFEYACKLQNATGGWYGSYGSEENSQEENTYFPASEISWANKYFLDALFYKLKAEFESVSESFMDDISTNDGRYEYINNLVAGYDRKEIKVIDVGCGKGRYISKLVASYKNAKFYAVDISENVMRHVKGESICKKVGTLTNIPFDDNSFDIAFTCEAIEHAVDVESAVEELARVVKPGGHIVIIDKNAKALGKFDISSWEQWFDVDELQRMIEKYCDNVRVFENVLYEDQNDNLFCIWDGKVK